MENVLKFPFYKKKKKKKMETKYWMILWVFVSYVYLCLVCFLSEVELSSAGQHAGQYR